MKFLCDFHLHSCLSPCGSLDSSPASIARAAKAAGVKKSVLMRDAALEKAAEILAAVS